MSEKVGMVFVENLSSASKFSAASQVSVMVTDGITTARQAMKLDNYQKQNFWIAGCYRLNNGTLSFTAEASFINNRPDEEVPDYCLKLYKN